MGITCGEDSHGESHLSSSGGLAQAHPLTTPPGHENSLPTGLVHRPTYPFGYWSLDTRIIPSRCACVGHPWARTVRTHRFLIVKLVAHSPLYISLCYTLDAYVPTASGAGKCRNRPFPSRDYNWKPLWGQVYLNSV